jgi:predicted DNA-binding transcriptional regulator YafY
MHDEPSLTRHLLLIRTLIARRFGATVKDLARELGVTEKTIRRDFNRLKQCGFPLVEATEDRGRKTWGVTDDGRLPPLAFAFDEAVVLYLARPFLEPLVGTELWEAAHSAMRKIRATLSAPALEYLDQFPGFFHSTTHGFGNYSSKSTIIDALINAIEDRKAVHITYQSQQATEPTTRDVYPYGLVRHKGSLYLAAFAPEHEQIRHYKIDRMDAIEVSKFVFQRPADFEIADHLAGSFGIYDGDENVTVVVKFLPAAARYVRESKWHHSQALTPLRDGSLLARFQLSTTVEIKSWVLSFGTSAVVVEPEELRLAIVLELEQLIKLYQSQPVTT